MDKLNQRADRSLKLWQFILVMVLQFGGAIWWASAKATELAVLKDTTRDLAAIVTRLSEQVQRIDTEGSRRWNQMQPDVNRASDRLDIRLQQIEKQLGDMSVQLARVVVVSEQNQKLLKQ